MSDLDTFVRLSVLPPPALAAADALLRAGRSPREALMGALDSPRRGGLAASLHPADVIRRATVAGLDAMTRLDDDYPRLLTTIPDPPPLLWIRGTRGSLSVPAVAIVGSRSGSHYALLVAERLAHDLAACGVAVVSGLARGVDGAAHRGALAAHGVTVAVLGSGGDVIYPREHARLAAAIADHGAVISELLPGTPPRRRFFPQRNRIISGLAHAIVVVEAGDRSGSLVTARLALEQGRDVLVVPGSVLGGRNRGGHALIRDGAKIVETADDILEEIGVGIVPRVQSCAAAGHAVPVECGATDPLLRGLRPGDTCDFAVLVERAGLPVSDVLQRLLDLELRGVLKRAPGGRFVLS
jgi:DNA processing protein